MPAAKTHAYGGLVFQLHGDSLIVSGSFSELDGTFDASIAGGSHLHVAPAGMNGDVTISLNATVNADMKSGVYLPSENRFELTTDQKQAIMDRMFYVNIHTTSYAGGELRGQVTPPVTASFYSALSGSAELPSVNSMAYGAVIAELHGNSLFVSGSFQGLESDFDASIAGGSHLHAGHAGTNGGVDFLLTADTESDLRSGMYHATDNSFELSTEQKATLMARGYYLNIHTMEHAGGELRGQLLGDATAYFKTTLSGMNEIHPIMTEAMGAINVEVSGETAIVSGGFTDLSSNFDASIAGGAHIHTGEVDANGDVSILLNTTVMSDTAGMFEAAMNTFTLTEAQLMAFYEEGMYVNIHTEAFAAGELRGQILYGTNFFPDSSAILTPMEGASLSITGDIATMFEATWEMASDTNGNELNYVWQLATDSAFTNVIVNSSVGAETNFTTDFGTLDDILASLDIEIGATATVYHRVVVSDGSNSTYSMPRSAMLQRGMVTAAEANNENPDVFALEQNYPNPFNPTTTINFTLDQPSNASIKVFNMLGQEVATLLNTRMSAGSHTVNFDASELSSGIYIYRLTAGTNSMTRKMMLIK